MLLLELVLCVGEREGRPTLRMQLAASARSSDETPWIGSVMIPMDGSEDFLFSHLLGNRGSVDMFRLQNNGYIMVAKFDVEDYLNLQELAPSLTPQYLEVAFWAVPIRVTRALLSLFIDLRGRENADVVKPFIQKLVAQAKSMRMRRGRLRVFSIGKRYLSPIRLTTLDDKL